MSKLTIVLLVILVVLIVAFIALYFLGKRAQKKKEEQDAQIAAASQQVTMLVIDKKRMRLKDAGLPQQVVFISQVSADFVVLSKSLLRKRASAQECRTDTTKPMQNFRLRKKELKKKKLLRLLKRKTNKLPN